MRMKASERAAIIKGTNAYYKCNNCNEMVSKEGMKTHRCSSVADIVHNEDAHTAGSY